MKNKKILSYTYTIAILNFIALVLTISSFSHYFKDDFNSNDLMIFGEPFAEITSQNSVLLTFGIANLSNENIDDIHAYVDVYDENAKLIGHGETVHDDIIAIRPEMFSNFTAKILLKEHYKNIKYAMIIPYSKKGVGKITLSFF